MELIKKEAKETEYTLKLTQKELNTLVIGMGRTSSGERESKAKSWGVEVLSGDESLTFFQSMKSIVLEEEREQVS